MGLKLGFVKSKTVFGLKFIKWNLSTQKIKLWNYRDLNDKNHWNPKIHLFLFLLPQPPSPQNPATVHDFHQSTATVQRRLSPAVVLRTRPAFSRVCWPRYLPLQRLVFYACSAGCSVRCWPRALLVAHAACVVWWLSLKFPTSYSLDLSSRDYSLVFYKFPRPILAYKISITVNKIKRETWW